MGTEVGCCGVWGVEVNDDTVGKELNDAIHEHIAHLREFDEDFDENSQDYMSDAMKELRPQVFEALKIRGIIAPEICWLEWSGNGDESLGRCDTQPETLIFGIGVFRPPWDWPPVDESFKKVAQLHTWAWGG